MPLLMELAITPDVFDLSSYASEELADSRFDLLRELAFNDAIIRNLYKSEWKNVFSDSNRTWYRRGREFIRKLSNQGRLRDFQGVSKQKPSSDIEWYNEALASHRLERLDGIISTKSISDMHKTDSILTAISRLSRSDVWKLRTQSVRLERNLESYLDHLKPLFSCANHLMFIDPYLDPSAHNYREFPELLRKILQTKPMIRIEIHRTIMDGKNGCVSNVEWNNRFRETLSNVVVPGVHVEIFFWDNMHDRYLISNIVGINLPYGFDTTAKKSEKTTWSRLGKKVRDDIQREFDSNSCQHKLQYRFVL